MPPNCSITPPYTHACRCLARYSPSWIPLNETGRLCRGLLVVSVIFSRITVPYTCVLDTLLLSHHQPKDLLSIHCVFPSIGSKALHVLAEEVHLFLVFFVLGVQDVVLFVPALVRDLELFGPGFVLFVQDLVLFILLCLN